MEDLFKDNKNINKDNIDYEIENFWLNIKYTMERFYLCNSKKNNELNTKQTMNIIKLWSLHLNQLQSKKQYDNINKNIHNYICLYSIDVLKYGIRLDFYYLESIIKKWNNITLKYYIPNNNINLLYICVKLFIHNNNKCKLIFGYRFCYIPGKKIINDYINLTILNNDITYLVKCAIKWQSLTILNKLIEYDKNKVIQIVKDIYGDEFFPKSIHLPTLKGKTIMKLLEKDIHYYITKINY